MAVVLYGHAVRLPLGGENGKAFGAAEAAIGVAISEELVGVGAVEFGAFGLRKS